MSVDVTVLLIIIGCAIVTIIPRIIPFVVVRKMKLPEKVTKWLSFIPVCIFTALIIDSFIVETEAFISIDWRVLLTIVPTLLIAIWTKNLSVTVIVGVVCMATVRYFL